MSEKLNPTEVKPESKKSKRGGKRKGAGRKPKGELSNTAKARLTMRQQRFVSEKISGKTDKAAALAAGYSLSTALVACRNVAGAPAVQAEFKRLLAQVVPDEFLVGKLRAGLNATKKTYVTWDGRVSDERRDPDYSTQHKFVDLACKIKQVIPKDEAGEREPLQVVIKVLGMASINVVQGGE